MKTIFSMTIIVSCLTVTARAEDPQTGPIKIPFADVKIENTITEKFSDKFAFNLNDKEWEKTAKIIIIDVEKEDIDKIKLITRTKKVSIIPTYNETTKELEFDLSKPIANDREITFSVNLNDKTAGLIRLTVTFPNNTDSSESTANTGDTDKDGTKTDVESYIGALTNANFAGNNKFLSNLTPIVNLGNVINAVEAKNFQYQIDINPYIGSDIEAKTPNTFIPALMLYGKAGFGFNNYLRLQAGKTEFILAPISFGLKVITNMGDSAKTILQHNLRTGIAFRFADFFSISSQATFGWHSLTSESKANFKTVFGKDETYISYLTTIGQFAFKGKSDNVSNYVYLEWRVLLSQKPYSDYSNNSILTLGIRKTFELNSGIFPVGTRRNSRNRNLHMNL